MCFVLSFVINWQFRGIDHNGTHKPVSVMPQGRRQRGDQWCPAPPFEIGAPLSTFGPPVAAYIQLKNKTAEEIRAAEEQNSQFYSQNLCKNSEQRRAEDVAFVHGPWSRVRQQAFSTLP